MVAPSSISGAQVRGARGSYVLGQTLADGPLGRVVLAEVASRRDFALPNVVAIKIVDTHRCHQERDIRRTTAEIRALEHLHHPNVVRLYEAFRQRREIFLVMGHVPGGPFLESVALTRPGEAALRPLLQQLAQALQHCHDRGVVHGDLSSENIQLARTGEPILLGFGHCHFQAFGARISRASIDAQSAAPEVVPGASYEGPLADVWSLGVIFYAALCYVSPRNGSIAVMVREIKEGSPRMPEYLTPGARILLRRMLKIDPTSRIGLVDVLSSTWLRRTA